MAANDQLAVRATPEQLAWTSAMAGRLGVTVSDLMRQLVDHGKEHFEKLATRQEEARGKQPFNISSEQLLNALRDLTKEFNSGYHVGLRAAELTGPRSKAMFMFLKALWGDDPTSNEVKLREKLAAVLQADVNPAPAADAQAKPERVRPYKRRAADE